MNEAAILPHAFTVYGAAHYSSISRTRLYEMIRDEELPSFTLGGRRMFLRSDLDALLEKAASAR